MAKNISLCGISFSDLYIMIISPLNFHLNVIKLIENVMPTRFDIVLLIFFLRLLLLTLITLVNKGFVTSIILAVS